MLGNMEEAPGRDDERSVVGWERVFVMVGDRDMWKNMASRVAKSETCREARCGGTLLCDMISRSRTL